MVEIYDAEEADVFVCFSRQVVGAHDEGRLFESTVCVRKRRDRLAINMNIETFIKILDIVVSCKVLLSVHD